MQYHAWQTYYDAVLKEISHKQRKELTYERFLNKYIESGEAFHYAGDLKVDKAMVYLEVEYMKKGRPYYNIQPNIISSILRTDLSKIPCSLLSVPGGFKAVNVRLPVSYHNALKSIFFCQAPHPRQLIVWTDLLPDVYPLTKNIDNLKNILVFDRYDNIDIESFLATVPLENVEGLPLQGLEQRKDTDFYTIKDAIRFCCVVKFLSDCPNDDLMQYDVISKLYDEYIQASPLRRQEIEQESRRRGKIGWNIGVSEKILGNVGRLSESTDHKETGKELTRAHIRTGHLHCVRFGPQKQSVKVMWYRPTVVRPDLPF